MASRGPWLARAIETLRAALPLAVAAPDGPRRHPDPARNRHRPESEALVDVAIVRATGARTSMHPLDIPIAETGGPFRPMVPGSGLLPRLLHVLVGMQKPAPIAPVKIDRPVANGDTLPIAGGLRVIGTPGHCAGQVAYLWRGTRLLIAGDFATNMAGLGDPLGFEDKAEGRRTQRKVAALAFDAIAFGHGKPIAAGASERVRVKWETAR